MTTLPTRTSDGLLRVADVTERLAWATYSAAGDRATGVNRDAVVSVARGDEGLFAVADGMGHLKGSENASRIAADRLTTLFTRGLGEARTFMERLSETGRAVCSGIREKIELEGGDRSMGTTLTGCAIFGGKYTVFHIGDSRLYHCSGGRVIRRTEDHTRQAEAERTGIRVPEGLPPHQLTRALMYADDKTTAMAFYPSDGGAFPLAPGDILIACTDGVHKHLTDSDFAQALDGVGDSVGLGKALERLALRALANGSADDRSLTGVYVTGGSVTSGDRGGGSRGLRTGLLWAVLALAALALGVLTFWLTRKPVEVAPTPLPTVEASSAPSEFASPAPGPTEPTTSPSPAPTPDPNSDIGPGDEVPPVITDPTNEPSPEPSPTRGAGDGPDEQKSAGKNRSGSDNGSRIRIPELSNKNLRNIGKRIRDRLPKNVGVEITIPRNAGTRPTPKPERPKATPKPSSSDDDPRRPKNQGSGRSESGKPEKQDDDPRRPRK